MPTPNESHKKQQSTYFVGDRFNQEELLRVTLQDQFVTAGMEGTLPELDEPARLDCILDVGCGTGGWLIDAAKTYPGIPQLMGIDISRRMIEYARKQAEVQQVSERVHFQVMDALDTLEFPDAYFDLVNLRFGESFLRSWDWAKMLKEFSRITRPKGIIRLTESEVITSNSPALNRLYALAMEAFHQAGNFFYPDRNGEIQVLARLLSQNGLRQVQIQVHMCNYRVGTDEGHHFSEDIKHVFRTIIPFLQKWTRLPSDYEEIYQQALQEMQQPEFVARWNISTTWGVK